MQTESQTLFPVEFKEMEAVQVMLMVELSLEWEWVDAHVVCDIKDKFSPADFVACKLKGGRVVAVHYTRIRRIEREG